MPSAPGFCAGNAEIGLRRNPHQDRTARTSNVTPVVAWNYAAVWDGIAQEVPDREAVVCGEQRLTWRAFSERAHRLAAHLQHCGLAAGDKVAIDLPNRTEYLEAFYGALVLGCAPVNVNFRYTADEIHYVLDNSDALAVIHAPEQADERRGGGDAHPARPASARPRSGRAIRAGAGRGHARAGGHPPTGGRRPDLPLHRRHHGHAQGRDVAQRGHLRRHVAPGASARRRTTRPHRGGTRRQAGGHASTGVPVDARHRAVHHAGDAGGRGHRRAHRRHRARSGTGVGHHRTRARAGDHDRR